jgi:hypothetical protein
MSRTIAVQSARDLGPLFADNPHRMIGQDGAFSIPLGDQTLWFFGDTLIGKRRPNESLWFPDGKPVGPRDMSGVGGVERMINNSGLLVPTGAGPDVLKKFRYICDDDGELKTLLPLEGGEHPDRDRIWCQHGVLVRDRPYLSFIKVRMLDEAIPPLPIGFEIVGSGLAVGSPRDWNFRRIERDGDSILWRADQPHFATAFMFDPSSGRMFLYGTVRRDGVQRCYLARVPPDAMEDLEAYEYLASGAPKWSRSVDDAVPIFDHMPSELSVSFNEHLGRYLAVHSLDLTGAIVALTSHTAWGSWSEPVTLWQVQVPPRGYPVPYPTLIYAGKEHPELASDGGRRIYLTYVEFEEYFPHLVEVTLE